MRHIELGKLELPDNWEDEAKKALEIIEKLVEQKLLIQQILDSQHDVHSLRTLVNTVENSHDALLQELKLEFDKVEALGDYPDAFDKCIEGLRKLDKKLKITDEIDKHAEKTWRAMKHYLSKLIMGILPDDEHLQGKCWYCESVHLVWDLEVDHFRPKGSVRGDKNFKSNTGYWWLAFDAGNFRLSCTTCNRLRKRADGNVRGKGIWFPLDEENKRAYNKGDEIYETPLLLDPTRLEDVDLLVFLADGRVEPKITDEKTLEHRRAKRSIEIYHLDAATSRRLAICVHVANLIIEANNDYKDAIDERNTSETRERRWNHFENRIAQLFVSLQKQAAYSAAAKSEAMRQAVSYEWVQDILEEVESTS